jgi:hypothetical protein
VIAFLLPPHQQRFDEWGECSSKLLAPISLLKFCGLVPSCSPSAATRFRDRLHPSRLTAKIRRIGTMHDFFGTSDRPLPTAGACLTDIPGA